MNYHNIVHDDMRNGTGLRVTLFVSGCNHHCDECQNEQTWDSYSGIPFDEWAEAEIFEQLSKDYISGITFSGGDPMHENNLEDVLKILNKIHILYKNSKTIWLYTGFKWEQIMYPVVTDDLNPRRDRIISLRRQILENCDVIVDGRFVKELADINYPWAGSTNQRVIDVKKSLEQKQIVLWK